ncbi:MAG: acyl-CoA dehydrogenase [Candidatus Magasanikbacteria bacterium]|jgi:indole-3-acetate monooxygenase|nr:acyl-CoA dehydrogenase [Candidatus Magasanikbacteria bacterium]
MPTEASESVGPLARARRLAAALDAAADQIEQTRRIGEPLLTQLHEARLFRMLVPRDLGGDEVSPDEYLLTLEDIARHDASVAWNIFVGNSAALIAPFLEPEAARAIFTDPRAVVAWGPPHDGTADAEAGGYRVSGKWDFASGCRQATWMGVHCRVREADGSLRLNNAGRPTIRSLLFPRDQATLIDTWDTIGLRGTASDSYSVNDVFVPEAYSGTREDPSLRRKSGPLYAFPQQGLYAVGVAGVALGTARAMLSAFVDLAVEKTPRGLSRLADTPAVQSGLARNEAALGAARAYLLEALREVYAGAGKIDPIDIPDRARVRLGATHAIHSAIEVTDWVYKEAGVSAIFPGTPFERRFRDMHTLSQQIQSRGSHYEAAGQVLLGNPPEVYF